MKNLNVGKKLLVFFLIVIVLITAQSVTTLVNMNSMSTDAMNNQENIVTPLEFMVRFSIHFGNARSHSRDLGHDRMRSDESWYLDMFHEEMDVAVGYLNLYHDLLVADPDAEPDEVEATRRMMQAMVDYRYIAIERLLPAMGFGGERAVREAFDILHNEMAPLDAIIAEDIAFLTMRNTLRGEQSVIRAEANLRSNIIINIVIVLVIVLVVVFLGRRVSGSITIPLKPLTTFFERAAEQGDLDLNDEESRILQNYKDNKDELGKLATAVEAFTAEVKHEMDMLGRVADGDLTVKPNVLSDNDIVGKSLVKVLENLNNMFGEITAAATHVSDNSRQISDGSQVLAQGSTEQAATVQELSASAAEIAEKTKLNAEMASKASELAGTIKLNAEKGSKQMDEMVGAVNEISQASHSISKVIKAIDDIAFQTNILALNAAVEAARAGQHGKGFAVVAEEVRTLAAKSAEAAKDTGVLISNSMEKAEHGAQIAQETADSLAEIVAGINESSTIISEIAVASEVQTSGIIQINTGINQVATVVQQNSATAQESAAAAQELTHQAEVLQTLLLRFKLLEQNLDGKKFNDHRHEELGSYSHY